LRRFANDLPCIATGSVPREYALRERILSPKRIVKEKSDMSSKQRTIEQAYVPETPDKDFPHQSAGARESTFQNATRIQESLTSSMERRTLLWMAARTPSWISSDHLTLLGFAAMLLASGSYALARWNRVGLLLATLCLALNWLGDSLDGTLARFRDRQRPRYGFYVDHMTDSVGAPFLMAGLAASTYVDWRVAAGMLVGYLLLAIESYLASYTLGFFRLSFWKFGPTEIRILLAFGNVALWLDPHAQVPGLSCRLLDFGGLISASGMAVMVVLAAISHTALLYRQETQPRR
jgi:archaetidylinositol phosphate synthase